MTTDRVLFITLDSCRFDSFRDANLPNMKAIGPLHKARSPGYFTYASHSAMFVGFTPGIAELAQPFLNPKFGKLFRLRGKEFSSKGFEGYELSGRDIIEGFKNLGYTTIGSGAMPWFDRMTPGGLHLTESFEHYLYAGPHNLDRQLAFLDAQLAAAKGPTFTFLNVGETHVPYWHKGASWSAKDNPCKPFQTLDRSSECRSRQIACAEFVDQRLAGLLEQHLEGTILICADHGDCWGEDGLWAHGIMHEMTTTVPLLIRHRGEPISAHTAQAEVAPVPSWRSRLSKAFSR